MPKRSTINDVRSAGYDVAIASGSVSVEEEALAAAHKLAGRESVTADAGKIATEVAAAAVAQGARDAELEKVVAKATKRALEQIQGARDERVAFHERALENARSSPDVWFVSALGDPETSGDDVRLYVACKPDGTGWSKADQETLNVLAAQSA